MSTDLFQGGVTLTHVPAPAAMPKQDGTTAPMFVQQPEQPLQTPRNGSVPGFSQPSPVNGLTPNGLPAYTPNQNGREQSAEDPRAATGARDVKPKPVSHPATPAERDPGVSHVRDMQAETRNQKSAIAALISSWK